MATKTEVACQNKITVGEEGHTCMLSSDMKVQIVRTFENRIPIETFEKWLTEVIITLFT